MFLTREYKLMFGSWGWGLVEEVISFLSPFFIFFKKVPLIQ